MQFLYRLAIFQVTYYFLKNLKSCKNFLGGSWYFLRILKKCNVLLHSRNWKLQYVFTKCYTTHKISIIKSSEHGNPFSTRFTLPCLWIRNFRKHMHFQLFPSIDSWFFRRYVNGLTTVHQETINDAINAINWYFTMCLFRR